jgi:SAM-dependent methyltransferase
MIKNAKYKPQSHAENRMKHEGDVPRARQYYFENKPNNLRFLLSERYKWMNDFIKPEDYGIEVGGGTGLSKLFINCKNFHVTDYADYEWLDKKNVDAMATPYKDGELDFVMNSNMIHHVASPLTFLEEMHRILKPGGLMVIQEIQVGWLMRKILKAMRHEGYDFTIDVFDKELICTDPDDLWSANTAIPRLLFDDEKKFHEKVPYFEIVHQSKSECLVYLNSGGIIAKTVSVPLPTFLLKVLGLMDKVLIGIAPNIFALQRQIVLRKK